jgi:uncharacterized membrane protein YfcA
MILAAIVFLGFVVEATAGFGATVVTVSLAAQVLPIDHVLAVFTPVNLVLSGTLAARHRRAVDLRFLARRVLPWMGGGMVLGLALFQVRHLGFLRPAFACFVVVLAAAELLRRRDTPPEPLPRAASAGALAGAGVIHGLFACGGPLAVYAIGREIPDKGRFRATLSALWLAFHVVLIVNYTASGVLGPATLKESVWLLPSLLLGLLAGEQLHRRVSERRFRQVVSAILLAAGLALLARSL